MQCGVQPLSKGGTQRGRHVAHDSCRGRVRSTEDSIGISLTLKLAKADCRAVLLMRNHSARMQCNQGGSFVAHTTCRVTHVCSMHHRHGRS